MQHEATDIKAPESKAPQGAEGLTRAALLGLCGGILLGGLFLLGVGLKTHLSPADCTGMSEMECGFRRDADQEMGRLQLIMGSGLLALGAAVVVLLRSRARPASS
ncbi:hypothetical protein ATI61_114132 [Archangium gephyra]|uniref:Uncharacterized protein n=1 Tax=Archangium gephyra TaxID=48 RepID=A0AAC8Q4Z0_9BACT|nr:hypothetical protein [Archangium gephyra]AKJ01158.1 Hypothetical protein AA314_02784 [Archangium gephyra]REG24524.1 hypothetical protein ATI61_114132 [Archangium gephyra]